jgi:hypothetical protein
MDQLTTPVRRAVSAAGGRARMKKLSPSRRSAIARKAALARWDKVTLTTKPKVPTFRVEGGQLIFG